MPVVIKLDRTAEVLRELDFLAHHEVRVGMLTGPTKGNESAGDDLHVAPEPLSGNALRDRKIATLARKFKRQDKSARRRK